MIAKEIDINCDVGEGVGNEKQLFPYISSCNIACGGHAGDDSSMLAMVRLAKEYQVLIGAHPAYPDPENFGRISMSIAPTDLIQSLQQQLDGLLRILEKEKGDLHHIKPHGALYNDLSKSRKLTRIFLKAFHRHRERVFFYAPYGSVYAEEALEHGFFSTL